MKRIAVLLCVLSVFSPLFAKTYSEYLADAKKYESQKKWVYALDAYYDAMGTDGSPESKQEAYEGYKKLTDAIEAGNPGVGKFNDFTLHDEWKKLLMESEVFFSSFNPNKLTVHELKRGDLDYKTKTATYTARIDFELSDRYLKILPIIADGFETARKDDWTDLPKEWPFTSVSYKNDFNCNIDGAKVIAHLMIRKGVMNGKQEVNMNPFVWFDFSRYENWHYMYQYPQEIPYYYEFNIVDENGNELAKTTRLNRNISNESGERFVSKDDPFSKTIVFTDITPNIMDLIDQGKAFVNPIASYLEYGAFSQEIKSVSYKMGGVPDEGYVLLGGGSAYGYADPVIKRVSQAKLPKEKSVIICWNNKEDKVAKNVAEAMVVSEKKRVVNILLKELGHIARGEYEYGIYKFGEERYFENKKSFDLFKDKKIYYESFKESYSDKELMELAVELESMFPGERKAWLRSLIEWLPKGWDKEPAEYYDQKLQFIEDVCKKLKSISTGLYFGLYDGKFYFFNEEKFKEFSNMSFYIQGKNYSITEILGFAQSYIHFYSPEAREWINNFIKNLPEGWNGVPKDYSDSIKMKDFKNSVASYLLEKKTERRRKITREYKIEYRDDIMSFIPNLAISMGIKNINFGYNALPYVLANILSESQGLDSVYYLHDRPSGNHYYYYGNNLMLIMPELYGEDTSKNGWRYVLNTKGGYFTRTVTE